MSYIGNSPGVASQRVTTTLTATAAQTQFTTQSGYVLGYVDVYLNGAKLVNGSDFEAITGTYITLFAGAASGDVVELVSYVPRGLSDGYTKAEADSKFLDIGGDTGQVVLTATGSATAGAGQVYLNGAASNRVEWNTNGTGAPAFTTRSAGTKLLLYPAISGSQVDYAVGIDAATLWSSVPVASSSFKFKWFGGQTEVASLDGTGTFVVNTLNLTNALGVASGGTGATTANAALNALLPAQTGNATKYLQTDGTNTTWDAISISTADITGTLPVANGGTGATTAAGALTSLGAYAASNPSGYTTNSGTVTSVGGTGTVNGLTLTGTVSTTGNLTLGGTLDLSAYSAAGAFSTLSASGAVTLSGGTANGVPYLNGSKVLTTGSALTFDGTGSLGLNSSGNGTIAVTSSGYSQLILTGGSTANYIVSDDPLSFYIGVGALEAMRLTNTSFYTATAINVGIGTTSINARLVVEGPQVNLDPNIYITQVIRSNAAYNASPRSGISFAVKYHSNNNYVYGATIQGYKNNASEGDYGVGLLFTTQSNGSTPTQSMTLGADGNLLVGTTTNTNSSKLVVNGTISQTVGGTQYQVVDQSDIGTAPNEIPLNQYLGSLAYQNGDAYYNTGMTVGFRNRIINGAMVIDQRNAGASVSMSTGTWVVDRFRAFANQSSKMNAQQNAGSVTPPVGFKNYIGFTSTSSYSALTGDRFFVYQGIEGYNTSDLNWGSTTASPITLSFWARSSLIGTHSGALNNNASTRSYAFTYTINSANVWEYKTINISGDTTGSWLTDNNTGIELHFNLGSGSTYLITPNVWQSSYANGAIGSVSVVGTSGATLYITGVQLEKGNIATSFDVRPYGAELALCQRYCFVIRGDQAMSGNVTNSLGIGVWDGTSGGTVNIPIPVSLRTAPTSITVSNPTDFQFVREAISWETASALVLTNDATGVNSVSVGFLAASDSRGFATRGRTNSSTASLIFNSEL